MAQFEKSGIEEATMQAAVYKNAHDPLEIRDVAARRRPESGEVQVQVARVGICGSDLHVKEYGSQPEGVIFGHEFAGVISALGEGTSMAGPWVTAWCRLPIHNCGTCEAVSGGQDRSLREYRVHRVLARSFWCLSPNMQWHLRSRSTACPKRVGYDAAAMVEPLSVSRRAVSMAPIDRGERGSRYRHGPNRCRA